MAGRKSTKPKTRTVNKSAKSGKFVSAKYAKKHKATTFRERVKR